MTSKEYKLPNGKTAVFEYDSLGIGQVTLECMDELMAIIAAKPVRRGKWQGLGWTAVTCSLCGAWTEVASNYCPHCGALMEGETDDETDRR